MLATLFFVTLFSVFAIRGARADLSVDTPSLIQCSTAHFSWSTTNGPYQVLIVPADDPCGDPIYDVGSHDGDSMSWNVTLPAGQQVIISVEDGNGDEEWSDPITVGPNSIDSCLTDAQRATLGDTSSSSSSTSAPSVTYGSPASSTPQSSGSSVGGAANAGSNPIGSLNGAMSVSLSKPAMILGALAAAFVATL